MGCVENLNKICFRRVLNAYLVHRRMGVANYETFTFLGTILLNEDGVYQYVDESFGTSYDASDLHEISAKVNELNAGIEKSELNLEMKPCPNCESFGYEKVNVMQYSTSDFSAMCDKCGLQGGIYKSRAKAIEAWDNRPIEERLEKRIKEVETALEEAYKTLKSLPDSHEIEEAKKD